jgi:hypothetical protein
VLGRDGTPLVRIEPTVTPEEFRDHLLALLD